MWEKKLESHRTCEEKKLKNQENGRNDHPVPASSAIASGRELEKKVRYRHGHGSTHARTRNLGRRSISDNGAITRLLYI
jgi:hypothetical protein